MSIITVNITDQTRAGVFVGFGKTLILTKAQDFAFRNYDVSSGLGDLANEWDSATEVNKKATSLISQSPAPREIAVFGDQFTTETTTVSSTETLTLVSGNTFSFANQFIKVGSLGQLQDAGTDIPDADIESIDYEGGQITFASSKTTPVTVANYDYWNSISDVTTALTTLRGVDDSWRYLIHDFDLENYRAIRELSVWTEAVDKYLVNVTSLGLSNEFPLDVTPYSKSAYFFTDRIPAANDRVDGAVVGYLGGHVPGTYTLKFKTLAGITKSDITPTQKSSLATQRLNTFTEVNGLNIVEEGVSGTGFIDTALLKQYISSRIQEQVFNSLVRNDKIPGTQLGLDILVDALSTALDPLVSVAEDFNGLSSYTIDTTNAVFNSGTRRWTGIQIDTFEEGATHFATFDVVFQ